MPPDPQPSSPSSDSSAPGTADGTGLGCFLAPLGEAVEGGEIHIRDEEGESEDGPLMVAKGPKLPTAGAVAIYDCTACRTVHGASGAYKAEAVASSIAKATNQWFFKLACTVSSLPRAV
jgi:hypothetical protein